ncbi:hypothetical protein GCM10011579_072300 [Streptomyces albiflavescens]|uniref:Uncharacterized protein n=1 Tax=Streptomyces albiflavescens TaxID=1623582 RepID=A0A918D8X2_9ACTN|nr:hypothetical protein [Streptomyces albiflavescens]GGN83467.1 hypothetical protein GCM10011579_072300 [Streptomyces albiflavescens]
MSYGQGGQGQPPWDPWKPGSQQSQWGNQTVDRTPDWAALAEASESRNKRRRLLFIGGGALATVAVGAAVAVAVVSANGDNQASNEPSNLPATATIPSDTTAPAPSFAPTSAPPPLDPRDFISSAKKDTAPLSPDILFPGTQLTMGDRVYRKGPTADTKNCASAAKNTLLAVLRKNDCTRFLRVTYTKDGVAVTVGVAVFDTEAQATKAKGQADKKSIVASLSGNGVKPFCDSAVCRSTTNSYGRYAYFTLAGFTNGKDVTPKDTKVFTNGDDIAEFTFRQIHRRGEAQASAAANE